MHSFKLPSSLRVVTFDFGITFNQKLLIDICLVQIRCAPNDRGSPKKKSLEIQWCLIVLSSTKRISEILKFSSSIPSFACLEKLVELFSRVKFFLLSKKITKNRGFQRKNCILIYRRHQNLMLSEMIINSLKKNKIARSEARSDHKYCDKSYLKENLFCQYSFGRCSEGQKRCKNNKIYSHQQFPFSFDKVPVDFNPPYKQTLRRKICQITSLTLG